MTEKRAYLVLGPESSGTRLMTRLLLAAGCYGDDGHVQRLDTAIPDVPRLVWRRSLPHDKQWPDVIETICKLQNHDCAVTVLVMSRDWHAMAHSQVAATHAPDKATAINNVREAYRIIFNALVELGTDYELVNFEALVMRPHATVAALLARLGLPMPDSLPLIHDANAKHYVGISDLAMHDRDQMRADIETRYGFTPPEGYLTDLLALTDALMQRPGADRSAQSAASASTEGVL